MRTPAAVVDTRGIAPAPERLLSVTDYFLSAGARSLFFDLSERFPWSLDARLCGADAFPEELIAEIDRRCTRSDASTYLIQRSMFPARADSVSAYRRMFRETAQNQGTPLSGPLRRFLKDLVEDAVGLAPGLSGICWVLSGSRTPNSELIADYLKVVAEEGIEAGALTHGTPDSSGALEVSYTCDGESWPVAAANDLSGDGSLGQSLETRAPAVAARLLMSPSAPGNSPPEELVDGSPCIAAGEELERYWEQAWRSIGRLHGLLGFAAQDPRLCGYELAGAVRELRGNVRRAGKVEMELIAAYAGRAIAESVRRYVRPHFAAVREQYAALAARANNLRSLDHFTG